MLTTAEGEKVGESKIAARQGISMVVMSRVFMAAPGRSGPWLAILDREDQRGASGIIIGCSRYISCVIYIL